MKTFAFSAILFIAFIPEFLHAQFDASYDSRTYGYITSVKDQGPTCGACWSFASCAAIEASWLKHGYGSFDLSEDNLTDCHNFDPGPCDWGNFYITNSLLSTHMGILTEANDPYTTSIQDCPFSLTFPPTPSAYIEEIRFIEANNNDIKQAILDFGAVASSMFFNGIPANYDPTNFKYYDATIGSEDESYAHCVTIVGWDNNMTFSGAPANGGWIIKDSYGTSWADNGYFYCSYYDAGILSSNVIFPSKIDIPPAANTPNAYYYDEFGWVNNYGFTSNEAYALIKYTITPSNGNMSGQQLKRIGTYAVTPNSNIDIEIYRTKTGNTLSNQIATGNISCPQAGFYTIPVNSKTDTIGSTIYIKVKYTTESGDTQPIPIEEYEQYSSSAFTATTGLCWISNDGNNWTQTGTSTPYNFDLCIKMYTENAPTAKMSELPPSVCMMEEIMLNNETFMPYDSLKWYANNIFIADMPSFPYLPTESGTTEIKLIVWSGQNSDTTYNSITVYENPEPPTISQIDNQLESNSAFAYQWLFGDMTEIVGETNQTITPPVNNEDYIVQVFNQWGCFNYSAPYHYYYSKITDNNKNQFKIYPNPAKKKLTLILEENNTVNSISITDISGKIVYETTNINNIIEIDLQGISSGMYMIRLSDKGKISTKTFIKE